MKVFWFTLAFFTTHIIYAQEKSLTELLNFPIGGIWVSENKQNDNQPESFSSFYMKFQNWSSEKSVTGDIYGVRNNGDTLQLIEVWNYTIPSAQHAILVQRTSWGAHCSGTVAIHQGQHLDIVFKTTNPDGSSFWTRDIHYIISDNEMKAETYHRQNEEDSWVKMSESNWKRKRQD